MKIVNPRSYLPWLLLVLVLPLLLLTNKTQASNGIVSPRWRQDNLPSQSCGSHSDCHRASPVITDITGDGRNDIVIATSSGHVMAFQDGGSNGSLLWDVDIAGPFGMSGNSHEINSSPAVADLDGDGQMEIVIGAGTINSSKCTQGGVIVLEHNGQVKSGWPFRTRDEAVAPLGCTDTVYSTPALGDLDQDGDMEIVFGSFDKGLYALHHNGSLVAGFPITSAHYSRFGWDILVGRVADTIWSSPALADLDQDGYLDIVIGTDEGYFGNSYPGGSLNWSCPYVLPAGWASDYCGGSLYAVDRFGKLLPGFPRYMLETIQSSPAIDDVDGDGDLEIFVGTGTFYNTFSTSHPTNGYRLFGFDHLGNDLPGWGGGKAVGGTVPASPVIGDIAGDERPEIIVAAMDSQLYAWHEDGTAVSGFPMTPRTEFGNTSTFNVEKSFVLADYDNDGKMEIFIAQSWSIAIIDGNGQQLTTTAFPNGLPLYYADGLQLNTPAVGDVDGDGILELVASNSRLIVWDLPDGAREADWPMHRQNAARTGVAAQANLRLNPTAINLLTDGRTAASAMLSLYNSGSGSINWSLQTPERVTAAQTNGSFGTSQQVMLTINGSGLGVGTHDLGSVTVQASVNGRSIETIPATIPVRLTVVNELHQTFLPLTLKK